MVPPVPAPPAPGLRSVNTVGAGVGEGEGVVRLPPSVTGLGWANVVMTLVGVASKPVEVIEGVPSAAAVDVAKVDGGAADEGVQQDRYDTDRMAVPV